MKELFQTNKNRYQPGASGAYATINQRSLALLVGIIALGLPLCLLVSSNLDFLFGINDPFWNTCFRDSISHYYYAQFWGGPFIGALIFIGAFLLVYQGEDAQGAESRLATYAAFFAFGVALFPTVGHGCDDPSFNARALVLFEPDAANNLAPKVTELDRYFELFSLSATLHYASAAFLFGFLSWFALFVFTSAEPHQRKDGKLTQEKTIRNALYIFSGSLMLICMAAMGLYALLGATTDLDLSWWNRGNWTFWCELIALLAFGISWMVKGRFWGRLEDIVN